MFNNQWYNNMISVFLACLSVCDGPCPAIVTINLFGDYSPHIMVATNALQGKNSLMIHYCNNTGLLIVKIHIETTFQNQEIFETPFFIYDLMYFQTNERRCKNST